MPTVKFTIARTHVTENSPTEYDVEWELFNLAENSGEVNNLAAELRFTVVGWLQ